MLEIAQKRREQFSIKWNKFDTDFLPLWVADMDFKTCPEITSALQAHIKNETFGYTQTPSSATEAVVNWCQQHYDWEIQTDWITWLPGIVPAFHLVNELFHRPEQTVLIPSPNYPPLLNSAKNLGQSYQAIPHIYRDNRWYLDFDALKDLMKKHSISILSLANPANPSGYVLSKAELNKLHDLCTEHDALICSDEIHCDLVFSDEKDSEHHPIGKIAPERSITLMAASKTFNIAGLNTAFAIIPDNQIRGKFQTAASHRIGEPTLLGFAATEAAFTHGESWRQEMLQYLQKNRDIVYQWGLDRGLEHHYLPTATHLYWLDIPSKQWIDKKVMPSDGAAFGVENYSRLNFACDRELLLTALGRLSI